MIIQKAFLLNINELNIPKSFHNFNYMKISNAFSRILKAKRFLRA